MVVPFFRFSDIGNINESGVEKNGKEKYGERFME